MNRDKAKSIAYPIVKGWWKTDLATGKHDLVEVVASMLGHQNFDVGNWDNPPPLAENTMPRIYYFDFVEGRPWHVGLRKMLKWYLWRRWVLWFRFIIRMKRIARVHYVRVC